MKSHNNTFVTFLTGASKFVTAAINHQASKRLDALFQTTTAHLQPHPLTSFHFPATLSKMSGIPEDGAGEFQTFLCPLFLQPRTRFTPQR